MTEEVKNLMKPKCKKCGKHFKVLSNRGECFFCNPDSWTKDNEAKKGTK